jgi:hypothetical protein
VDDDDHINGPRWTGILNDVHSWNNFRAFVHNLHWGVEVATSTFQPQVAPVEEISFP